MFEVTRKNLNLMASRLRKRLNISYADAREFLDEMLYGNDVRWKVSEEEVNSFKIFNNRREVLDYYHIPHDLTYTEVRWRYGIYSFKFKDSGKILAYPDDVYTDETYVDPWRENNPDISSLLYINM